MKQGCMALVAITLLVLPTWAQGNTKGQVDHAGTTTADAFNAPPAVCTFADGKQLTVRYSRPSGDRSEALPDGRVWPAGGSMFLFTPVVLSIGNSQIPVGAFSLYVIPGHDDWTLIVNKNVTERAKYDETQDLSRTPMKIGSLSQPATEITVYFAHIAPKQCNMRLYYGKIGAWAEFREH